ncbi:unnamed protein product, partial [Ixodes persulcatus]
PGAAGSVDLRGSLGPRDRERLVPLGVADESSVLAAPRRHHAVLLGELGRHCTAHAQRLSDTVVHITGVPSFVLLGDSRKGDLPHHTPHSHCCVSGVCGMVYTLTSSNALRPRDCRFRPACCGTRNSDLDIFHRRDVPGFVNPLGGHASLTFYFQRRGVAIGASTVAHDTGVVPGAVGRHGIHRQRRVILERSDSVPDDATVLHPGKR